MEAAGRLIRKRRPDHPIACADLASHTCVPDNVGEPFKTPDRDYARTMSEHQAIAKLSVSSTELIYKSDVLVLMNMKNCSSTYVQPRLKPKASERRSNGFRADHMKFLPAACDL